MHEPILGVLHSHVSRAEAVALKAPWPHVAVPGGVVPLTLLQLLQGLQIQGRKIKAIHLRAEVILLANWANSDVQYMVDRTLL